MHEDLRSEAARLFEEARGKDDEAKAFRDEAIHLRVAAYEEDSKAQDAEKDAAKMRARARGLAKMAETEGQQITVYSRHGDTEAPGVVVKVTPTRVRVLTLSGDAEFYRRAKGYQKAGEGRGDAWGTRINVDEVDV